LPLQEASNLLVYSRPNYLFESTANVSKRIQIVCLASGVVWRSQYAIHLRRGRLVVSQCGLVHIGCTLRVAVVLPMCGSSAMAHLATIFGYIFVRLKIPCVAIFGCGILTIGHPFATTHRVPHATHMRTARPIVMAVVVGTRINCRIRRDREKRQERSKQNRRGF